MQRIIAQCIGNRNAFAHISDPNYCAAVGASALESANIVGYQDLDTNVGGAKMKAAPFLGVGAAGAYVSSLTPKGYEANQDIIDGEGTTGEFNIQLLTSSGGLAGMFRYVRSYDVDNEEWNDDGHWEVGGTVVVPGSANDPVFKAGSGLWTAAPDWAEDDGAVYSFTDAGEVSTNE